MPKVQRRKELSEKTRELYDRALKSSTKRRKKTSFNPEEFIDENLEPSEGKLLKKFVKSRKKRDYPSDEEDVESQFESTFNSLMDVSKSKGDSFRPDDLARNTQRAMLTLVLNLIPKAELACLIDMKQSNAYALNSFLDQARSLADDLKSAHNSEDQHAFIYSKILIPMFLQAANTLLHEMSVLKAAIDTEVSDKHAKRTLKQNVDDTTRSLGKFLAETQSGMSGRILSYLQGDVSGFDLPTSVQRSARRKRRT